MTELEKTPTLALWLKSSICGNIRRVRIFDVRSLCETLLGESGLPLIWKTLCGGIRGFKRVVILEGFVPDLTKRCSLIPRLAVPGLMFGTNRPHCLLDGCQYRDVHGRYTPGTVLGSLPGRLAGSTQEGWPASRVSWSVYTQGIPPCRERSTLRRAGSLTKGKREHSAQSSLSLEQARTLCAEQSLPHPWVTPP